MKKEIIIQCLSAQVSRMSNDEIQKHLTDHGNLQQNRSREIVIICLSAIVCDDPSFQKDLENEKLRLLTLHVNSQWSLEPKSL